MSENESISLTLKTLTNNENFIDIHSNDYAIITNMVKTIVIYYI